ncbi:MAG: polysaccharide deacetylase family protein [Ignavibacteria bacterium]|nr:polysaccharide deacetylase family protein [Ignavibacteria bacterium]
MYKILFLILFILDSVFPKVFVKKEICITVDDLPYIARYHYNIQYGKIITDSLLSNFKQFNVIALGSVNSSQLYELNRLNRSKVLMLERWLDSGMVLANHTYSHKNLYTISVKEYIKDVIDGEIILKDIINERGKELKYFRHPYLLKGETKEKADSINSFLKSRGYIETPVTIDNYDYYFSLAFERAMLKNDEQLMNKIGKDYIIYMEDALKYYEAQSIALFGYNIKHIIILHANIINAYYIRDLLNMLQRNGYKFISIEEALKDKCYESKDEFYQNKGVSWLRRWAWTLGYRDDIFFNGEPEIPDYINKMIGK